MEFGIGIIGATGYIGRPYRQEIRNAGQDATIIALCARRQDLLVQAGREANARLVTSNWKEVVEHPDVNLVMVLTPDALHFEPVLHAADLGKHVFCEKPIGTDVAQAEAAQAAGLAEQLATMGRHIDAMHATHKRRRRLTHTPFRTTAIS